MSKTSISVISLILGAILVGLLIGGCSLSCREGFWDKNKQVIEIKHS